MKDLGAPATAARLVRSALRISPTADKTPLRVQVRQAMDGLPREQRMQLAEQLAWLARSFAVHVPDDVRESVLAAADTVGRFSSVT